MNPNTVFWLSILGVAIGGADGYWQVHSTGSYVLDAKFYIGMAFAAVGPVGAYFVGLAQKSPWEKKAAAQEAK
jgi:hypothetical protein